MAYEHALSALREFLAVVAGKHDENRKAGRILEQDMGSIKRVMLLLDENADPERIRPRRTSGRAVFALSVTDFVQDTLRELPASDGLSRREIAERALRTEGRDPNADPRICDSGRLPASSRYCISY